MLSVSRERGGRERRGRCVVHWRRSGALELLSSFRAARMATIARGVAARARGAWGISCATRARGERRVATRARVVGRDDEGEGDEEAPIRFWLHRVHATDVTLSDVARSHGTSEEYLLVRVRVRVRATDVRARGVCVEYRARTDGTLFRRRSGSTRRRRRARARAAVRSR